MTPYNLLPLSWVVAFVEMMANGLRFSLFSRAKTTLPLHVVPGGECQVGLTVAALSLALSHGEREQITEVMFADKDGEWYEGFLFSWAKPTLPLPVVPNGELQVGLTVAALSLALSHGERGSDN